MGKFFQAAALASGAAAVAAQYNCNDSPNWDASLWYEYDAYVSLTGSRYINHGQATPGEKPGVSPKWLMQGTCNRGTPDPQNVSPPYTKYPPSNPTVNPTVAPVWPTAAPTVAPVWPTAAPTVAPVWPTAAPTVAPVWPTAAPTLAPVWPTAAPTVAPVWPTAAPTVAPVGTTVAPPNPSGGGNHRDLYIYSDWAIDWSLSDPQNYCKIVSDAAANGVNHIMASFWVDPNAGLMDFAAGWAGIKDPCKQAGVSALQANGGQGVIMSCGGATAANAWTFEVNSYTKQACAAATSGGFQGIDFDLENFGQDPTQYVTWLVTASKNAKTCIGWVSHAPQSPYFGSMGWGGLYDKVIDGASGSIDKLLIQYYNQGSDPTDYNGLFVSYNGASIGELQKAHPKDKDVFVVGKPNGSYQGSSDGNTPMAPADLNNVICQGENKIGYVGGIMLWMDHADNDGNNMYKTINTRCA